MRGWERGKREEREGVEEGGEDSYHLCCMWGSWRCLCVPSESEGACPPSRHKPIISETQCQYQIYKHWTVWFTIIIPRLCFQLWLWMCLHWDERQCHRSCRLRKRKIMIDARVLSRMYSKPKLHYNIFYSHCSDKNFKHSNQQTMRSYTQHGWKWASGDAYSI